MKLKQVKTGSDKSESKTEKTEDKWILRLYVAGQTTKSVDAFKNLKSICEEELRGNYKIEVVDLVQNPKLCRDDQIFAVPTLVRKLPVPVRKIIGLVK